MIPLAEGGRSYQWGLGNTDWEYFQKKGDSLLPVVGVGVTYKKRADHRFMKEGAREILLPFHEDGSEKGGKEGCKKNVFPLSAGETDQCPAGEAFRTEEPPKRKLDRRRLGVKRKTKEMEVSRSDLCKGEGTSTVGGKYFGEPTQEEEKT